eukprot:g3466.t1
MDSLINSFISHYTSSSTSDKQSLDTNTIRSLLCEFIPFYEKHQKQLRNGDEENVPPTTLTSSSTTTLKTSQMSDNSTQSLPYPKTLTLKFLGTRNLHFEKFSFLQPRGKHSFGVFHNALILSSTKFINNKFLPLMHNEPSLLLRIGNHPNQQNGQDSLGLGGDSGVESVSKFQWSSNIDCILRLPLLDRNSRVNKLIYAIILNHNDNSTKTETSSLSGTAKSSALIPTESSHLLTTTIRKDSKTQTMYFPKPLESIVFTGTLTNHSKYGNPNTLPYTTYQAKSGLNALSHTDITKCEDTFAKSSAFTHTDSQWNAKIAGKDVNTELNRIAVLDKMIRYIAGRGGSSTMDANQQPKIVLPDALVFRSSTSSFSVKCYLGTKDGFLFPLSAGFFFYPSPFMFIPLGCITGIACNRGGSATTRTFDLRVSYSDQGSDCDVSFQVGLESYLSVPIL